MNLHFPPAGAEWTFFVCALVILVAPLAVQRLRLPGMVGLVLGGLLIGPNLLDWVPRVGVVEDVGQLGLLLLMFLAGLELDLDEFVRRRTDAVRFGLLTFAIPLALGAVAAAAVFDYGVGAAILFGSLWASHTLVSYPIVRAQGLAGERPVSMAVSGTVITDTLALFVLALVVGAQGGGSTARIVGELVLGLALLLGVAFLVVPVVVGRFFAGPGQDRGLRFVAVVATFTGVAVLAHVGGLEGIVGAFFAGLAINRLVPNQGPLMERLEFFGSSLLVPFFLISTGMIIDPAKFSEARTLALGAVALAVVIVGKAAAAMIAGRWSGFNRQEIGLVFSLTVAQAAATLATVTIGYSAGIFGEDLVNAALVVVLVSLVVASVGTGRFAARLVPTQTGEERRLGETVLVPLYDDDPFAARVRLAALLARADTGVVAPVSLSLERGGEDARLAAKERLAAAVSLVAAEGAEVEGAVRVVEHPASGTLRAAAERDASCIVASWSGVQRARGTLFGRSASPLVAASRAPVLVVAPGAEAPGRVVLALSGNDMIAGGRERTTLAGRAARRLATALDVPLDVLAPDPEAARPLLLGLESVPFRGYRGSLSAALNEDVDEHDLVVMPASMRATALDAEAAGLVRRGRPPTVVLAVAAMAAGRDVPSTRVLAARA